ncbi:hypothetical protein F5Y15DRAFT_413881 [Xylariaceae sp. FL0016]|nr:hypothetical protein F5Y15DRAFT_413881 [Xylariaceae sp. FL0016]
MGIRAPGADTLAPLPQVVRSGSTAIVVFAVISFFSALGLFVYLTTKIVRWQLPSRREVILRTQAQTDNTDFTPNGLKDEHLQITETMQRPRAKRVPNQFLVLIINLLLADLHQATAFSLSSAWVSQNGIMAGTPTCFAQGFFISTGDLSSSCFISAIAIHTYLSIVKGYRLSEKVLYSAIGAIWAFVYLISVLPIIGTHNGYEQGGWFVRAGAWCWINHGYENMRLLTHYLFIFISIAITLTLYLTIFFSIRHHYRDGTLRNITGRHHPAFLAYPVIYLVCILPLALGRIATMAGSEPTLGYFCFAGSLTASNGWLDVVLFTTTRHTIVFAAGDDLGNENTGIETFAFMRTPAKSFGNMIWVQGGHQESTGERSNNGWWRILGDSQDKGQQHSGRCPSQTSLPNAIQMDIVTQVVVEDDRDLEMRRNRNYDSRSISMNSTDRIKAASLPY